MLETSSTWIGIISWLVASLLAGSNNTIYYSPLLKSKYFVRQDLDECCNKSNLMDMSKLWIKPRTGHSLGELQHSQRALGVLSRECAQCPKSYKDLNGFKMLQTFLMQEGDLEQKHVIALYNLHLRSKVQVTCPTLHKISDPNWTPSIPSSSATPVW